MSGYVKISRRAVTACLAIIGNADMKTREELTRSLRAPSEKRKTTLKAAKKTRAEQRAEHNAETAALREGAGLRSGGNCEACGVSFAHAASGGAEMDHFWGRGKAKQTLQSVWMLCGAWCHRQKTNNRPSAAYWLTHFIVHCEAHGYQVEEQKARARLQFVLAKNKTGVGPLVADPGERCEPRWGSCTLHAGHKGQHSQSGPFAGIPPSRIDGDE